MEEQAWQQLEELRGLEPCGETDQVVPGFSGCEQQPGQTDLSARMFFRRWQERLCQRFPSLSQHSKMVFLGRISLISAHSTMGRWLFPAGSVNGLGTYDFVVVGILGYK